MSVVKLNIRAQSHNISVAVMSARSAIKEWHATLPPDESDKPWHPRDISTLLGLRPRYVIRALLLNGWKPRGTLAQSRWNPPIWTVEFIDE